MTDLAMAPIVGEAIFRLALWDNAARDRIAAALGTPLPGPCRAVRHGDMRLLWLEDGHWLLACRSADAEDVRARTVAAIGADGTLVDIGAALVGRKLTGAGWRDLLMVGGVLDAEDPGFGAGCVARTVMHHAALLIDVIAADAVHAYVPASHADDFFGFWDDWFARQHRSSKAAIDFKSAP